MTRAVLWIVVAASLAGCSDSSTSPSTNSTGFPDIIGTWLGSRTVNARLEEGTTTNNVCAERWSVKTQAGASFTGTFETGGAPCLQQAGAIEGTITTAGALATFSINMTVGEGGPCVVVSQSALSGGFSTTTTVDMRFSDVIACASGPGTSRSTTRTVSVALTRQ